MLHVEVQNASENDRPLDSQFNSTAGLQSPLTLATINDFVLYSTS